MPLPLIALAISLASKFGPSLIGKLTKSDKAEEVAEKVVGFAKIVTGQDDPQEAAKILETNPALALQFQQSLYTYEIGLAQEDTRRLEAVNKTMQAETVSGSVLQKIWRPINGLLFGFTLWCDYFLAQIIIPIINYHYAFEAAEKADVFLKLGVKPFTIAWQHIPMPVYILWAGVLGAAVISRGKEKITKTKINALANGIPFGGMDLIKEFGRGIIGK